MKVRPDLKKNCLKRLWKDIFEDTKEYIDLIFNNIYNENISPADLYEDPGSRTTEASSGLVGVDYELYYNRQTIPGAYICGVATRPEFRRNGKMGEMIKTLLRTLSSSDYQFAFLIPAGDDLRRYYSRFGFVDMSPRHFIELITPDEISEIKRLYSLLKQPPQNNESAPGETLDFDEFSGEIEFSKLEYISELWYRYEINYSGNLIRHNKIQRQIAIRDILASGGKIFRCTSDNTLAFMEIINKEGESHSGSDLPAESSNVTNREIKVTVLGVDESSFIRIIRKVTDTIEASAYKFIIAPNIPIPHLKPMIHSEKYGMIHFLDSDENLKFASDRSTNFKYPILANNHSSDIFMFLMMD